MKRVSGRSFFPLTDVQRIDKSKSILATGCAISVSRIEDRDTTCAALPRRTGVCYHARPYDRGIRPWQILRAADLVQRGLAAIQSWQQVRARGGQRIREIDLPEDVDRRGDRQRGHDLDAQAAAAGGPPAGPLPL